jgi:uncharacterized protein (TIGR02246 family)
MKKASFSIVCLAILTPALLFSQTQGRGNDENKAKDEALIRKLLSQSEERWNKHDAEALAALQAEDIDHINTSGGWSKGREAIRKLWAQLFETRFKEDITEVKLEKIRFLKPDVAVAIVRIFHKRPAEATESLATFVMTKDGDKWQVVSYQATRIQNAPKKK